MHTYYAEREPQIRTQFLADLDRAHGSFQQALPGQPMDELRGLLLEEWTARLQQLPFVGGDRGRMTRFFEVATGFFAVGRVLRRLGVPMPATAAVMRRFFLVTIDAMTPEQRRSFGRHWLSPENMAYLRAQARDSELGEHPDDFVYRFVEAGIAPDGTPFSFGLDYTQCGFCKLAKVHNDADLLPVMCSLDEEIYALREVKLVRTQTIAGGATHCNFRFAPMPDVADPVAQDLRGPSTEKQP